MTLKTDIINDLDEFFNVNEFADSAIYTPATPDAVPAAPITLTDIATGYPTILIKALHGLEDSDVVTLDNFAGIDADLLNGETVTVEFATDNTFAVAIDTTGKTITDNSNAATATALIPATPAPVTVRVIFSKEYDAMSNVGGFRYYLLAKTSDFATAKPGETIEINSVTYKIKAPPHHTGDGMSEIELSID